MISCSANPSEDDHAEAVLPVPTGSWTFFAVLDGHSGWETSAWLRNNLIPASVGALVDLYHSFKRSNSTEEPQPPPESISQTLKQTFRQLDDDIVHEPLERVFRSLNPRTDAVNLLAPAHAGSCALLAFYDSYSRLLHVALTGDSRAVLGRRVVSDSGNVSYEVHVLSMDQNGNNLAEEARLNAEHPGETVVKNGRVLGMGMSRAFGDARYKWDRAIQMKLKEACMGRSVLRDIKTPPYLTAEPEVTSFEVQPGDFLILATDGLWEALTNDDAVGLVGWWRNSEQPSGVARSGPLRPAELPVIRKELSTDELSSYHSVRYGQWGAKKSFIRRDENAATHLIRNAIGGADKDLVTSILSMRPPRARTYMCGFPPYSSVLKQDMWLMRYFYTDSDDLTVTVVFFAETSPTRELTSV